MSETECVVCGRPTPDGYACVAETERARRQLLGDERCDDKPGIVDLVGPARDVAYRQTTGDSTAHGAPGPRDLLDYGAGAKLDAVQTALTGWARQIAEERGVGIAPDDHDLIFVAAHYVSQHLEWSRHKPWVDELLREVGDCVAAMRSVVATPAGRVYLGVCGAERAHGDGCKPPLCDDGYDELADTIECDCWCHRGEPDTCQGDVYGKPDRNAAYCQTCGAAYDQAERRTQVAKLVDGKGFRVSVIAHAHGISADTIRGWAWVKRDEEGRALNDPKLKPVGNDERGRPLYLVADVLALAAAADQRRQQRMAQGAGMGATA